MKKRIFAVILAALMLLSACGGSGVVLTEQTTADTTADTTAGSASSEQTTVQQTTQPSEVKPVNYPVYTPEDSNMYTVTIPDGADSGEKGELFYVEMSSLLAGLSSADAYDLATLVACMQGLLNRDGPRMFVNYFEYDTFWFNFLRFEPEQLLYGYRLRRIGNYTELLELCGDFIKEQGLVLWDPEVPATINAATTVCGVDGYLPVRNKGAVHDVLLAFGAEVKLDMSGMFDGSVSGSKKCDVYLWAIENYMDRTNPHHMGYILDGISWSAEEGYYPDLNNAFVFNRDYLVAERCFVFDLSPWGDELPCDDPDQPLGTDLDTFLKIMQAGYENREGKGICQVHGFTPWHIKYTVYGGKGSHGEVETEWRHAEILSRYDCVMDADAAGYCGLSNCSLYRLYPLKESYQNSDAPGYTFENGKAYVFLYMGDYDAAAWTTRFVPQWFTDPARGSVPLSWAFNPNLSERIPMVFDYIYRFKTPNDYFIGGDSGAGYLNPTGLFEPRTISGLPSGVENFTEFCRYYYDRFDISMTGFVIDGTTSSPESTIEMYSRFSPDGTVFLNTAKDMGEVGGMYYKKMNMDIGSIGITAQELAEKIIYDAHPRKNSEFFAYRTILLSPSVIAEAIEIVKNADPNIVFVDGYTFFDLMEQKDRQ